MPYFIYAVKPIAQLQPLGEHASFKEASAQAKSLRAAQSAGEGARIRVMFAETALAAEALLLQLREPGPSGDE